MTKNSTAKILLLALFTVLLSVIDAGAGSYGFTPTPRADLWDLSHGYYYGWRIDFDLPDDETITGATLSFDNIRNWNTSDNDLYVHLIDTDLYDAGAYYASDTKPGDEFEGIPYDHDLLVHYQNLSASAQDLTYDFDLSELGLLMSYLSDDKFALGFDPDCHFYNDGITLTIETEETGSNPVPEPGTMFLVGFGILGLAGLRRKIRKL